jgi:hypothetical protein
VRKACDTAKLLLREAKNEIKNKKCQATKQNTQASKCCRQELEKTQHHQLARLHKTEDTSSLKKKIQVSAAHK